MTCPRCRYSKYSKCQDCRLAERYGHSVACNDGPDLPDRDRPTLWECAECARLYTDDDGRECPACGCDRRQSAEPASYPGEVPERVRERLADLSDDSEDREVRTDGGDVGRYPWDRWIRGENWRRYGGETDDWTAADPTVGHSVPDRFRTSGATRPVVRRETDGNGVVTVGHSAYYECEACNHLAKIVSPRHTVFTQCNRCAQHGEFAFRWDVNGPGQPEPTQCERPDCERVVASNRTTLTGDSHPAGVNLSVCPWCADGRYVRTDGGRAVVGPCPRCDAEVRGYQCDECGLRIRADGGTRAAPEDRRETRQRRVARVVENMVADRGAALVVGADRVVRESDGRLDAYRVQDVGRTLTAAADGHVSLTDRVDVSRWRESSKRTRYVLKPTDSDDGGADE